MIVDIKKISEFFNIEKIEDSRDKLLERYYTPIFSKESSVPECAFYPTTAEDISSLLKYFRTIKSINVVIISSQTKPKFLDDTTCSENTVVLDLSRMKKIPFIDKRNKVCVVEPGVTYDELTDALEKEGLRPLAPLIVRPNKSVLASVLDREPHLIPKKQFDISDPLLCMEVVFGNGEIFRTGEAAGPLSLEENRKAGAALTNPLGPGQTDIFRIIQGSKGTLGCVTWISMQCDLIPSKRIIRVLTSDNLEVLTEFVYLTIRKRVIDEVFIVDKNLFIDHFCGEITKKYALIYAINGYEWLPDEKINYQSEEVDDILKSLKQIEVYEFNEEVETFIKATLDGHSSDPNPKYVEGLNLNILYSIDIVYNTTLNRVQNHINAVEAILGNHNFPLERIHIYLQPIIQARAVNVEISLRADLPNSEQQEFSIEKVKKIAREVAKNISEKGGFFSKSYKLINNIAFNDKNLVYQDSLKKIKRIFDPNNLLNRGQLIF